MCAAPGPTDDLAKALQAMDDIDYLVVTAGSFDFMCEVVVEDDGTLLDLTNRIRSVPGVVSTETFIYLDLVKQTFAWGAHWEVKPRSQAIEVGHDVLDPGVVVAARRPTGPCRSPTS